jgi:hypothetical protein
LAIAWSVLAGSAIAVAFGIGTAFDTVLHVMLLN